MSIIRERNTLCVIDLPKKLTSRRNLHAYFSKFGEVKYVSVNKIHKSGMVQFSSHFGAQAAKLQGKVYEGEPLNILWSEVALDSKGREKKEYATESEALWQDDDKECFGIEVVPPYRDENKQSAKDLIKQHLKLPGIKKRLGIVKIGDTNKSVVSPTQKSPIKLGKSELKIGVSSLKKTLSQPSKRKPLRKNVTLSDSKKRVTVQAESPQSVPSGSQVVERIDLKEKLALLDERDKLIRQRTVQDSDIKTAVAIKGTCPDMCPERERILRQCGHAIAVYEMFPGTNEMDENRAVKEYIRSSADQEVPLPHDLRPEPVLSMTMSYLIKNIISRGDNPEENKAVWYSFCWNRLRSVRKDIILQQLCDLETVKIVEQCARFHISCYDHMWEAEVSGFDDKINTQNVIDCLQTLKHLYEDLAKHNIKCPNEPEFYSYLILLKLTTGDVMWEFQQYSQEVQLSPQVQFAIEAYMAFKNNMYSKYFSLVKKASYLTACLMQRHFDEVRTKALKIMLKAYSLPNRTVGLTTSFLMESLKFDSRKSVLRFCEKADRFLYRILKTDEESDGDEDEEFILTSSFLIREKRLPIANAVVGENSPLPDYIPHQVHSSFDVNGKLRDLPQVVPNEDSEDSMLEQSDVSVPEVETEKHFKFSLSPEVIQENAFKTNVFMRLGPQNMEQTLDDSLLNTGLSQDTFKHDTSMTPHGSHETSDDFNESFYEDNINESFKMEEDIDQDLAADNNEMEQEIDHGKSPLFTTQLDFTERIQFSLKKSSSSLTTVSINNDNAFFQPGENKTLKPFSSISSSKSTSEAQLNLPFASFNDGSKKSFPEKNVIGLPEPFSFTSTYQPSAHSKTQHNIKTPFISPSVMKTKTQGFVEMEESPPKNMLQKTSIIRNYEAEAEAVEKENKEIVQKLLMKKAEEERIRLEEIRKAEIEKKKIEEQKALQSLRKDLRQRMKAINAKKYARIWKNRVEKLKHKRADFPMLHQLSVKNHLKLWGTIKTVPTSSISQRAKDKQHSSVIISSLLQNGITDSCKYVGQDVAESLAKFAAKTMQKGVVRPVFWKLAVSVPWVDRPGSELSVVNEIMKRCCRQSFYKESNSCLGSVEFIMTSLEIPVYFSVQFSDDLQSCQDLKGMDALIFVVLHGLESEKMCLQRLRSLVTSQVRGEKFSVAVMNVNQSKFDRVLKIELEELHEQGLLANWMVNDSLSPSCLTECLKFLTEHVNIVQDIYASSLELLIKEVTEEFFYTLSRSQCFSGRLKDALKNPNNVISFYNMCLTKLEDLLISSKLEKYFNFAGEFKTHIPSDESGGPELMCGKQYDDQYKSQISKKINSLKLPEFEGWPDENLVDFDLLVEMVKSYCSKRIYDIGVFPRVIRMLGHQEEEMDPSEELNAYSWLYVVEIWAESSIRRNFPTKEKSKRMFVVFNKNDVQCMVKKQWWLTLPIKQNKM